MDKNSRIVRIILADDHAIVRDGLRALLTSEPDFQVVAQAANGQEAVYLAYTWRPDVMIMDVNMPELSGIEAARKIKSFSRSIRILMLSMYSDPVYVKQALKAGATGYLIKQSAAGTLLEAVRVVCSGKEFISPELISELNRSQEKNTTLSVREMEILKLIANGKTGREIARELCLSFKTVDSHRQRLMKKLGLHDIASLTRYAVKHHIL
jgi:DNA-binding NarL/FixJ family response regulator